MSMNTTQPFNSELGSGDLELALSREAALIERFDQNLADYHASLEGFTPRELIGMADKIAATNRIHAYMTHEHGMESDEVDFFLQFQNPLEVVADAWHGYADDTEDMAYVVYDIYDKQDALADYPLMTDLPPGVDAETIDFDGRQRFMGVDLIDFLGKIADKVIVHYPKDWQIDVERLYAAAGSDDPEDKRMMWHVSAWGTHLNKERETFIRDTGAFHTWVDYPRKDSDTFGYAVEITGRKGHVITGNVFDLGHYHAHAAHVREEALVLEMLTLNYSDSWGVNAGKSVTVPRFEYDDNRHRLMSESGDVTDIVYHPYEGVREMSDLLRSERAARMAFPIGSMEAHLRQYDDRLADQRMPPEKPIAENRDESTAENDSAEEYHNIIQQGYSADYANKLIALTERLDGSLASFKDSLLIMDKREILERAGEASLMLDAHYYLTAYHVFEESELDYLLLFQDPLEVVTDVWAVKREDISDLSYSLHDVFDKKDALHGNYAFAADAPGSQAGARSLSGMKQADKKPSIGEKLRAGKEKADASRALNTDATTKKREKGLE